LELLKKAAAVKAKDGWLGFSVMQVGRLLPCDAIAEDGHAGS